MPGGRRPGCRGPGPRDACAARHSVRGGGDRNRSAVREEGDRASEPEQRFGGRGAPFRVTPSELAEALEALEPSVRAGLEVARANVLAVAGRASTEPEVTLAQGQTIRLREVPVRRAAVYAPGGRAPYPSSVVMGAVTARAAGVEEVVARGAPPGRPRGGALCGVEEVYAMSGAQAIAALAYGTETVHAVDVIVGPGNAYVQEAKRVVARTVGIDGFAGPSDLVVLVSSGADPAWWRSTCSPRPSTGRTHRSPRSAPTSTGSTSSPWRSAAGSAIARRSLKRPARWCTRKTSRRGSPSARPSRPSTSSSTAPTRRGSPRACAPRAASSSGAASATAFGDYVAGSTTPSDRRGRALRLRPVGPPLHPPDGRVHVNAEAAARSPPRRCRRRGGGLPGPCRVDDHLDRPDG